MVGLNVGCGPNILRANGWEWINSDICTEHNFMPDRAWDFLQPIPLPNESVDFIVAWHVLEHAGLHERGGMVKDWHRVLKSGGKLVVAVPNLQFVFEEWSKGTAGYDSWFNLMVNTYGPWNGFIGDIHKWGYNQNELERVLREEGGFSNVVRLHEGNIPVEIYDFTRGEGHERKVVLAPWAAQVVCVK